MKKHLLIGLALTTALPMHVSGKEEVRTPLRRTVEVGRLRSPSLPLMGSDKFDFEFAMNAQIYDVLSKFDSFVAAYDTQTPVIFTSSNTSQKARNVASDDDLVRQWTREAGMFSKAHQKTDDDHMMANKCVANMPYTMIGGEIRSFEANYGFGLSFGFGPGVLKPITGLNTIIDVSVASMDIGLVAYHPATKMQYGSGYATPSQTKVNIDLSIDLGLFNFGPRFFFESPLAGVTRKGLEQSLQRLIADMDGKATGDGRPVWESRIREDFDTHILLSAGARHGVKAGDEFAIYNMQHIWDGEPCRSQYVDSIRLSSQPNAIVRIDDAKDIGTKTSRALVIQQDGALRDPGAQVVIYRLAGQQ